MKRISRITTKAGPGYFWFVLVVFFFIAVPPFCAFSQENAGGSGRLERVGNFLKGEMAPNAVYLGMWSLHFSADSDYRTIHNLVGLQYKGYFLGTFANSHSHQVFVAGIARTIARKELGKDWAMEAGYKIGPMYGYRRGIPEYHRFSVLPAACFGISYRAVSVELILVPGNAVSFSTSIRF
ncbi:MAG TPA: hypothetical protein VLJ10_00910 [Candidatus Bathyarchaeia archaeon]|nr:hypothetical protein [Candidatus Bathyarchaeia archaeon]